ncbi:hypothetical protein ADL08_17310 [Streptomyces sp. NRRL F-6492]|nr:hypothetical protein ADL08_17310 [Streptomyces sp. NRRL F-6492]
MAVAGGQSAPDGRRPAEHTGGAPSVAQEAVEDEPVAQGPYRGLVVPGGRWNGVLHPFLPEPIRYETFRVRPGAVGSPGPPQPSASISAHTVLPSAV